MELLDKIPLLPLLFIAVILAIMPVYPEPHLVEKLRMLFQGTLKRPLDIFDLLWHSWPIVLLLLKFIRMAMVGRA